MLHPSVNQALNIFDPKFRELIYILFDARNEDFRISRLRDNPRINSEAIEFLHDLNLIEEEGGYISLSYDLIDFLERTLDITDFVSTSRIVERIMDAAQGYITYDQVTTQEERRKIARRIRKNTESAISALRSEQRSLRRLLEDEFRFETSLALKLEQLEVYRQKSNDFTEAVELCQRQYELQEGTPASAHPTLEHTRRKLIKQVRIARQGAAEIAHQIVDYIHRAKEGKEYLNKLTRISDLIERAEFESRTNLSDVLADGALARLHRASPIRTILPENLNGDEELQERFAIMAEKRGLIEIEEDLPRLEDDDEDGEESAVYLIDVPGILNSYRKHHNKRDLLTFLFEEPSNFPDDELLEERLMEAFCTLVTSDLTDDFFVADELGEYRGTRPFRHLQLYCEKQDGTYPRALIELPTIVNE